MSLVVNYADRVRVLNSSSSVKENNKSPTENKFVTPKSPSKKTRQRLSKNISSNNGSNQNSSNEVSYIFQSVNMIFVYLLLENKLLLPKSV